MARTEKRPEESTASKLEQLRKLRDEALHAGSSTAVERLHASDSSSRARCGSRHEAGTDA